MLIHVLAVLATLETSAPADPSSPQRSAAPIAAGVSADAMRAKLNDLLAAEGLGRVQRPVFTIRIVELDDNASTVEALVDVLTPEHCGPTLECTTLVVQSNGCGLRAIGHGRWLQALTSRTNGWVDLVETALLPIPSRALKFDRGRYR